nr:PAS domain S-box protein [Chelativorans sp. Marseille-P2723]
MNDRKTSDLNAQALEKLIGPSALLQSLPIGVCCCDRDGIIRFFNRRAVELWGFEPQAGEPGALFNDTFALFLPDGTPLARDQWPLHVVMHTHRPVRGARVVVQRADGSRIEVTVDIEPLFDEGGSFAGAVNCFQIVAEAQQSSQRSGQSRHDQDGFFDNGAVALHVVDRDGTILRANKAELDLLGYDESEYVGRKITDFHADQDAAEEVLQRLMGGEKLHRYPARLVAKDGSVRHVLITSSGLPSNGFYPQYLTVDVTDARLAEAQARDGEQRFYDLLAALPVPVYTTDAEGTLTFCNKAAAELAGRTPELGKDRCLFDKVFATDEAPLSPEDLPAARTIRTGKPLDGVELIARRLDGNSVRGVVYTMPLFGMGHLTGTVNIVVDITERHKAQVESAHLAAIVSSSSDAIISKTPDGIIRSWNEAARQIFGWEANEIVGQHVTTIIPRELHHQEAEILGRLHKGERIAHFETERITKDGRRIDISLTVSPIYDSSGRIVGASKVARDISERKRAERLQRLLISELNHRVKNTLATVQSIASQTVYLTGSPAEFAESFSGRIQALALAHDLLTRNSWQGTEVLPLVRGQLLLNDGEDDRITFSGPSLALDPQPALHLALVLHELGTNARKYGSLSVPEGKLSVTWSVRDGDPQMLDVEWREAGGPAVEKPKRRGFGTTLIAKSLAAHGGEATIHYQPEGVRCNISLPISRHAKVDLGGAVEATTSAHTQRRGMPRSIHGKRILIVEDEPLIAMDIAATLSEAGCVVIGPAMNFQSANRLIAKAAFDAALLDANLGGYPVEKLAASLTAKGIPFAFLTGYEREALPEEFRHAPLINKPFTRWDAIEIIDKLTSEKNTVIGEGTVIPLRQAL